MQSDLTNRLLRSVKRIAALVLVVSILLYAAACILLYIKQRSLLYFPTTENRMFESTNIIVESGGERLKILTQQAGGQDAVIYFGGNSEDVALIVDRLGKVLSDKAIYLVNYRGYGGSTGSPSEDGLFADALAVYDRVRETHANVSVIGRSLGTGVAVYLASVRKVDRLVLVTPYDSIENVAKTHFPFFPISILLKDKFDSESRAHSVTARTLIMLADNDEVIPRSHSERLIKSFSDENLLVRVIQGTDHNTIGLSSEYLRSIGEFLDPNSDTNPR
jgi:pimeloyl-ACP methyl ester carboxylesterase